MKHVYEKGLTAFRSEEILNVQIGTFMNNN